MRRLIEPRWIRANLALVVTLLTVGGFVTAGATISYFVTRNTQQADQNHKLICLIDRLFGLDRPVPVETFKKLRPIQRLALKEFIDSCPQVGRKGAP